MKLRSLRTPYSEMLFLRPDMVCGLLLWQQGCPWVCHRFLRGRLRLAGDATDKLMREKHAPKVEKVEKVPACPAGEHCTCVGLSVATISG